ncbi:MAG: hypothetical protein ACK5N8_03695 [Alphaproteobacteria bacterium]
MSIFLIAQICSFTHHHEEILKTHDECASCLYVQQISGAKTPSLISLSLEKINYVFVPEKGIPLSLIFSFDHYFILAPPLF